MRRSDLSQLSEKQQRALLAKLLSERLCRETTFPMSIGQQGLWHDYQRDRHATHFNVFLPVRIRGALNAEFLRRCVMSLVQRHESLRTTFGDHSGHLAQTVHSELPPEFYCHPASGWSDESLREQLSSLVLKPFDLERGPLLRVHLFERASDDWIILALTHHIVVDFWSLVLILKEVQELYSRLVQQQPLDLPLPQGNYRDFVTEQKKLLSSIQGQQIVEYWKEIVANTPLVLQLPTDYRRATAFTHRANCVEVPISRELAGRVFDLARQYGATPFSILHSALQILLSRLSAQESFLIGSPFSGRSHQRHEDTIGFFINMLPVRATVKNESSFLDLIQQTSFRLMETLEREMLPVAEIVRVCDVPRDPSRSPLFQVSCTLEKSHKREWLGSGGFLLPTQGNSFDFAGMRQENFYIPHPTCHYDLEVVFDEFDSGLGGMMIYCQDLFKRETINLFARQYVELLEQLLRQPERSIGRALMRGSTGPAQVVKIGSYKDSFDPLAESFDPPALQTVHSRILHIATTHPDCLAMQSHDAEISYAQLVTTAQRISRQLIDMGVQPNGFVPVMCQPGAKAFTGFLAVHLAGAAVVPLDRNNPAASLKHILTSLTPEAVLCDSIANWQLDDQQIPLCEIEFPETINQVTEGHESLANYKGIEDQRVVCPQDLAYLVYTSGSTGVPKGVLVEHASICNTLRWREKDLSLSRADRILMLFSHQFDAGLGIGWSALRQGAALIWADKESRWDTTSLIQQIIRDQITVLPVLPSMLRLLARHQLFSQCKSLHQIWVGGESLPEDLPAMVREKLPVRVWNLYGPTEASVEATAKEVTEHSPREIMSIGWPIDGMRVKILDGNHRPVPEGIVGQIAIGGPGLARGYFGDEQLTQTKFIPDPSSPQHRLYLTGDLGRMSPDGQIVFLGREDRQVKVSGYRIELDEIEGILESHPEVDRAAVIAETGASPSAHLRAYVSPHHHSTIDSVQLRSFLKQRLPYYKIPGSLVVLERMPLTGSGKVDRNRLPASKESLRWESTTTPPRNPLESLIANIWAEELDMNSVGIHENFFDAGGSSLQAATVTARLSDQLGVHVPTSLLFDMLTIAQIADRLALLFPEKIAQQFSLELRWRCTELPEAVGHQTIHPLLAPLKPSGSRTAWFMVHPPGGIVVCYRQLAERLSEDQPLWAIRSHGLHGAESLPQSLSEMATEYLEAVRTVQPRGPYILGGWSLGGLVAYEMASILIQSGELVERLILLDTAIPEGVAEDVPAGEQVNAGLEYGIQLTLDQLSELAPERQLTLLYEHAKNLGVLEDNSPPEVVSRVVGDLQSLFHHHVRLSRQHRLKPLKIPLLLVRPLEVPLGVDSSSDRGWRHLVDEVRVVFTPGHHHSMLQNPNAEQLAKIIQNDLA